MKNQILISEELRENLKERLSNSRVKWWKIYQNELKKEDQVRAIFEDYKKQPLYKRVFSWCPNEFPECNSYWTKRTLRYSRGLLELLEAKGEILLCQEDYNWIIR